MVADNEDAEVAAYNVGATDDDVITIDPTGDDVTVTANGRPVSSGVTSLADDDDVIAVINPADVIASGNSHPHQDVVQVGVHVLMP